MSTLLLVDERSKVRYAEAQPVPQPQPQLHGEFVYVSIPKDWHWTKKGPSSLLAAAAPQREVSMRVTGHSCSASFSEFAKTHFPSVPDSFIQVGSDKQISVNKLDIIIKEYHSHIQLCRVFALIKVNAKKDCYCQIQQFTRVSLIHAYRHIFENIFTSVRVRRVA
jgi:hypothetical protein